MFPDRAPEGGVLLRALLGGTFDPGARRRGRRRDRRAGGGRSQRAAGLAREPDFVDVWRARPGIPQYDLAHGARVRAVDEAVARLPGLAVIGHALRGVGVNDCIAAATRLAAEL